MNYETIKQEAKARGVKVTDLIALAPQNDPFYVGSPADLDKANWFVGLWERFGYGQGVHLRRIHYQAVSQDPPLDKPNGLPYENTLNDWGYLNLAAKAARYLGLVEPDRFVDKRNPDAIICTRWLKDGDWAYEDPTPGYEAQEQETWDGYELPELPELPDLPGDVPGLPGFEVSGYTGVQQDYHLEIWVEKTTMNDVLEPICRNCGVNLITGAGELSITAVVDLMRRVQDAGRPARILYISDYDPAGLGMPISIARKIEHFQRNEGFEHLDIRLQPIVLTTEQVSEYKLPRVPVKDSDKRKANWIEAHGKGQVELDALEALYPGKLAEIVTAEIGKYYDPRLLDKAWDARYRLQYALSDERDEVIDGYRGEIDEIRQDYSTLIGDFAETRRKFSELIASFQPEIDAYTARLGELRERGEMLHDAIFGELDAVDVDMPELPTPDLGQETNGTLYASRRGYFQQIEYYRAYRNGTN